MKKLKVIELFAGVGGFRLGLENTGNFEVVWSNQWEPGTKRQHASEVYEARFGSDNHSNEDIAEVKTSGIPDADVLVGGFPCQDYSVATTLKNSKGLIGKKGVLWWSIHRIVSKKETRTAKNGFEYHYTEGGMIFPDALDNASRTIITGEGGKTPSRFKHVVQTAKGLRRLTPVELERLNMFPDTHTELEGISDTKRAFFMGNALVVGVVEKLGAALIHKIGF